MPLRLINRERVKAQFQFEPRDLWVGVFWRVSGQEWGPLQALRFLHVYVCLIPTLPFHVTILKRRRDGVVN